MAGRGKEGGGGDGDSSRVGGRDELETRGGRYRAKKETGTKAVMTIERRETEAEETLETETTELKNGRRWCPCYRHNLRRGIWRRKSLDRRWS